FSGALPANPPINTAYKGGIFQTDRNVFGDREFREKGRLLIDCGDSALLRQAWRVMSYWCLVELNLAGVGCYRASDDLDQRRFACPVLSNQRVHFAGSQVKRRTPERMHARIRLIYLNGAKQSLVRHDSC